MIDQMHIEARATAAGVSEAEAAAALLASMPDCGVGQLTDLLADAKVTDFVTAQLPYGGYRGLAMRDNRHRMQLQ